MVRLIEKNCKESQPFAFVGGFAMSVDDVLGVVWRCVNSYSASRDNWYTAGGDGGCRVGEVRASTTSPMPDHKGFKLQ